MSFNSSNKFRFVSEIGKQENGINWCKRWINRQHEDVMSRLCIKDVTNIKIIIKLIVLKFQHSKKCSSELTVNLLHAATIVSCSISNELQLQLI